jgi:hypothetical protein
MTMLTVAILLGIAGAFTLSKVNISRNTANALIIACGVVALISLI